VPTEVTIEGEKQWRQIIATSRATYYLTGTPRRKEETANKKRQKEEG